ncbi:MAG: histidine phosphatase family protein [Deltaproteobacteria bacterium]|nr:histidine phosphatase family protein [Deltaproteobacteria bacterium]
MPPGAPLLLLLRHAIAEDPISDRPDEERRLTGEGKRKLREVVAGMRALELPLNVILTSPLHRTRETAAIVAGAYGLEDDRVIDTPALAPGGAAAELFGALAEHVRSESVLLVGHQPDLGELASILLVGTPGLVPLPFKKAGLAAIIVGSLPPRSAGTLEFFLTPGQLRRIGRAS